MHRTALSVGPWCLRSAGCRARPGHPPSGNACRHAGGRSAINQTPNPGSGAAGLSLSRHGTKDLAAGHARDAVRNLIQMFAFHPFERIPAGIANGRCGASSPIRRVVSHRLQSAVSRPWADPHRRGQGAMMRAAATTQQTRFFWIERLVQAHGGDSGPPASGAADCPPRLWPYCAARMRRPPCA